MVYDHADDADVVAVLRILHGKRNIAEPIVKGC
jgi:hypothetical protein